jgi:hypothetical protein
VRADADGPGTRAGATKMVEGEGGRRRARDESRHDANGTRGGAERARDESRRGGEQRRKLDEFVHLRRNWFTTKKSKINSLEMDLFLA